MRNVPFYQLLFVIAVMPVNYVLTECTEAYKTVQKINYRIYMDDIKVFANKINEKELETLIQAMRIYNHDREMEFDREESTIFMKCEKRETKEGIKLLNQKRF